MPKNDMGTKPGIYGKSRLDIDESKIVIVNNNVNRVSG